jgi:hypothetical protein
LQSCRKESKWSLFHPIARKGRPKFGRPFSLNSLIFRVPIREQSLLMMVRDALLREAD